MHKKQKHSEVAAAHKRAKELVSKSVIDDAALDELKNIRNRFMTMPPPHREFLANNYIPYPAVDDTLFQQKITRKKEFVQHKHKPLTLSHRNAAGVDAAWTQACKANEFRLTPTQLFLKTFMSPETPYNSLLLFHGVGVGKTCSAITIAEGFQRRKTLVLLNPGLQDNFKKEIFDINNLKRDADGRIDFATTSQCTGNTYIKRIRNRELMTIEAVERKITRLINSKYTFMGPRQFAHYVKRLGDGKSAIENIRRKFSGTLIIIDEAHHLRTNHGSYRAKGGSGDDDASPATEKMFTPALRRVLKYSDDVKLLMLTATPMFNDARDVIDLLNLMLMNDKRQTVRVNEIFDRMGVLTPLGKVKLQDACRGYVSYMRGENPFSFPIRLAPSNSRDKNVLQAARFPRQDFRGRSIPTAEMVKQKDFEVCASNMSPYQMQVLDAFEASLKDNTDIDWNDDDQFDDDNESISLDNDLSNKRASSVLHSGLEICNIVFPSSISSIRHGKDALLNCFDITSQKPLQLAYRPKVQRFLEPKTRATYSPKIDTIIKRILASDGVIFVYSRFLWMGLIPLAIALEHEGFERFNGKSMLSNNTKQQLNKGTKKMTYSLLCGMPDITPNATYDIDAARALDNVDGNVIKVILASDFATEGIDLRHVREVHVMDPWYHMNKIEQIVGRACRYCSHAALPLEKRNTTLYLHTSSRPLKETVDLYAYRIAQSKFERTKDVENVLISSAIDCNLNKARLFFNRDAINTTIALQSSQKTKLMHRIGDDPSHRLNPKCIGESSGNENKHTDDSTFDILRHTHGVETYINVIKEIFASKTIQATFDELVGMLPAGLRDQDVLVIALEEMLNNKTSIEKKMHGVNDTSIGGYLVYRGNVYVFQPSDRHVSVTLQERETPYVQANTTLIHIQPPLSTSSTTLASSSNTSAGTKLGHVSRGRSTNRSKSSSSSSTTRSKHSTAINPRAAIKWNASNILESLKKRVAHLFGRLPLNDYETYKPELFDMVIDRLKIHQLLDVCGFVIQNDQPTHKDPDMLLMKKSVITGLLLLSESTTHTTTKHFVYDPLARSFYITRNRGKSWIPCQAVDLQDALTLRQKRLEFYGYDKATMEFDGYVVQTTKPTPSGILFKVMATRSGGGAGCICHQTSSLTVSAIIKLIQKLNAKIIDINKSTDKRNLCEVYELALRKYQPRKILRPAIHPNNTEHK